MTLSFPSKTWKGDSLNRSLSSKNDRLCVVPGKKGIWLQEKADLLPNSTQELMDSYGADKTVVRMSIAKMAKIVPTCSDGLMMCIARAALKCCAPMILKRKLFSENVCEN